MLEKLINTFDKSVAAVSVKSETLVESSRTKTLISNAQKAMEAEINSLGQKVYYDWRTGELNMANFVADLERILGIENEIESLRMHLEEIKMEENRILGAQPKQTNFFCTACGKQLSGTGRFCDGCGAPIGK